ncbi:GIY-YIG nuclease family protein [Aerococcaceae bacterium DSM 111020]|nr:GIY-YIG nuclease family protein [Aerococcaceae bacterium DSM 111020]
MEKNDAHYFYVLYCQDDTLYGGYTNNLSKRVKTHNQGKGAKYTRPKTRRPVTMIYAERFSNKSAAMSAEYHFKKLTRPQKVKYLKQNGKEDISDHQLLLINQWE